MRNEYNTPLHWVDNKNRRKKLVFSSFLLIGCVFLSMYLCMLMLMSMSRFMQTILCLDTHEKTDIVNSACSNFPQANHFDWTFNCVNFVVMHHTLLTSTFTTLTSVFALIHTSLHALYTECYLNFIIHCLECFAANICMQNFHNIDRKHLQTSAEVKVLIKQLIRTQNTLAMHHRKLWMVFSFCARWGCGCGWEWKTNLLWHQLKIGELLAIYFNDIHYET